MSDNTWETKRFIGSYLSSRINQQTMVYSIDEGKRRTLPVGNNFIARTVRFGDQRFQVMEEFNGRNAADFVASAKVVDEFFELCVVV